MKVEEPSHGPFVLGLCGGSCSGKTTLAKAIVGGFPLGDVSVLTVDAYYRPLGHLPFEDRYRQNFDHPSSIDHELVLEHLDALVSGSHVREPVYDFATHSRTDRTRLVEPAPILLVEGILLFALPGLSERLDWSLFLDCPEEERLARRIRRDAQERGRREESVREQFRATVAPMHEAFVQPAALLVDQRLSPQADWASVVIDLRQRLAATR